MARTVALTTTDNPYDPLNNFEEWQAFDENIKGYYSCAYLDRVARTSSQLTDEENAEEIERAIDEIVAFDLIAAETDDKVHYKKFIEET